MIKIAITGNIASGKTQVENILSQMGYIVYDTDKMTHNLLDKIDKFYDYDVFTEGKIDRKKLGALVFNNEEIKIKLENLIHPMVKNEIQKIFNEYKNQKAIFISVPLLFEAKFETMFDKIIIITTTEENRIKRLMERNNLTREDAIKRIASQLPEKEKLNKADYIIENNNEISLLNNQITQICKTLNI